MTRIRVGKMIVDGKFYAVSMFWYGPKKTDPETGFQSQPTLLLNRVYDDVKSGDEAFGKAYAACLADFDETGWTLDCYTVMELETKWSKVNEEE